MLCGDRIYLRLMEASDISLKVKWTNDPEIRETLIMDYTSETKTKQWLQKASADGSRRDFMIVFKNNDQAIGFSSLKDIDYANSKAEMTICIGEKEYWGKGFALETRTLIINYAFTELGLNKVFTFNWVKNGRVIQLNEKLGFKVEGTLRQHIFFKGEFRDFYVMGLLKNQWK